MEALTVPPYRGGNDQVLAIFIQVCYSFHVSGGPGKIHSIGKLRSMVWEMLAEELGRIDELVEPMLKASA